MRYSLPYGKSNVVFEAPEEQIIFTGEMRAIPKLNDIEAALIQAMDNPIGAKPLRLLAKGKKNIVFLVEDGTRDTPLSIMMPVITDYLNRHGIPDDAMSFLTAPGTHRIMTEGEMCIRDSFTAGAALYGKVIDHRFGFFKGKTKRFSIDLYRRCAYHPYLYIHFSPSLLSKIKDRESCP